MCKDDPLYTQAQRLWERGFGRELGLANFEAYLEGLPPVPTGLIAPREQFPLLCLADPRPGLSRSCTLLRILFKWLRYKDWDVVPYDDRHVTPTDPFWFRFTAPGTNMNRPPLECRDEFIANGHFAGTAMTGIMAYAHYPGLIEERKYVLDLPGSRYRQYAKGVSLLQDDQPLFSLLRYDDAKPIYGAGGFCLE